MPRTETQTVIRTEAELLRWLAEFAEAPPLDAESGGVLRTQSGGPSAPLQVWNPIHNWNDLKRDVLSRVEVFSQPWWQMLKELSPNASALIGREANLQAYLHNSYVASPRQYCIALALAMGCDVRIDE